MDNQKLVEKVTYTASLVSNRQDIYDKVDTLSEITARGRQLTGQDIQTISSIQDFLEDYLTTKETMRSFTRESLNLQIEQHMAGDTSQKSKNLLLVIVSLSVLAALLSTLLPNSATFEQRIQLAGATAFSLITVGAAIMFLNALASFKSQLRNAFLVICAGVTLLGLSLLEQPFMEFFELRQYPIVSILYALPILLAAMLFYIGIKKYVQTIGINNFWTSVWPILIGGSILSLAAVFSPHLTTTESEAVHDFAAVIWGFMLTFPIVSAIILKMSEKRLPDLYRSPIRTLYLSMFPIIAVVLYQFVVRIIAGPYMQGIVAYVLFSMVFLMGLTILWAGYTFNKVSRY
ncbi:MAG TPA: hypothetical protein VLA77_00535 [Candidatus Saccharimonadales bacterium]|nr:hypothetical protein [Candidatus Saccharimonadales bacterium]